MGKLVLHTRVYRLVESLPGMAEPVPGTGPAVPKLEPVQKLGPRFS